MTLPPPPPGQGPVDPRGVFSPPPPPPAMGPMGPMPPMPPMMMPPPFYPPPPPAPRGGFGRAILTTLATSIFGLSIALNIYLLLVSGFLRGGGDGARLNVLERGDLKQKVIVIPITGIIDDAVMTRFSKSMGSAEKDTDLKALVVEIDSPGGSVTASDAIYARIRKFKDNRQVPVVVSMGGVAASGGYYVACAGDKIVAQRTTITGSIGVVLPRLDLSRLAERWGIEDTSLASTGAKFKTAGSWLRPETEEERLYWLGILDDAFATFKGVITTGRGSALKRPIDDIADGRIYTASEALQLGLVDQLGYPEDAYALAATLAGLSNRHVVRYEPVPSLFEVFGAESKHALPSAGKDVNINGINVNLQGGWIHELMIPRLMYLWNGR